MLRLNEDCLFEIFRLLNLRQQTSVCSVCTLFRNVVVDLIWQAKFKELNTADSTKDLALLSSEQFKVFIENISPKLERLIIGDTKYQAFSSYLGRYADRPDLMYYMTVHFPVLCELDIQDNSLHDGHMRLFSEHCPQLQILRFASKYVTGVHINRILKLRKLYAPNSAISTDNMVLILRDLRLTHLDIIGNIGCNTTAFEEAGATDLQELRISERFLANDALINVIKSNPIRLLHAEELYQEPLLNLAMPTFIKKLGSNIIELYIHNTSSYTNMVNVILEHLDFLCCLRRLRLNVSFGLPRILEILSLPTMRELYISGLIYPDILANLLRIEHLTDVYIDGVLSNFPNITVWALMVVEQLRKSQRRSLITVHMLSKHNESNSPGDNVIERLEQNKTYQEQNLIKITVKDTPKYKTILANISFIEFGFEWK